MDNRLLLVKSITLLYRESMIPNVSDPSSDLVRTALGTIKLGAQNIGIDTERKIITGLKETALEMCDNGPDHEYEKSDFLQRIKMNTNGDDDLYDVIAQGIEPEMNEASLKRTCVNIRKQLQNHFRESKVAEVLTKAHADFTFRRDKIANFKEWLAQLIGQLEPFQVDAQGKDPAVISDIDIGDENGTAKVFEEISHKNKGDGLLKTGWQEMNNMLQGGFARGDNVVIGALQHKYKTGMTLNLTKHLALYNKPYMFDPTKKPMILRISFEDDITTNLKFIYKSLKENETGVKENMEGLSDKEMSAYIRKRLEVNGYNVKFMRVDPTRWSYMDICNKITELESQGFEVHALVLDYLAMLPTTGCVQGGASGQDVRDMFRRVRNFTHPKKITMITPHQLSSEAKQLVRDGRQDFVKEIAEKGYYDKCKSIDQEVDIEIYIHIEKVNKQSYLTVQRGKHRGADPLPENLKYFVLPFTPLGIMDDIGKPNSALRKVGGGPIGSGEEIPFWDNNPGTNARGTGIAEGELSF